MSANAVFDHPAFRVHKRNLCATRERRPTRKVINASLKVLPKTQIMTCSFWLYSDTREYTSILLLQIKTEYEFGGARRVICGVLSMMGYARLAYLAKFLVQLVNILDVQTSFASVHHQNTRSSLFAPYRTRI